MSLILSSPSRILQLNQIWDVQYTCMAGETVRLIGNPKSHTSLIALMAYNTSVLSQPTITSAGTLSTNTQQHTTNTTSPENRSGIPAAICLRLSTINGLVKLFHLAFDPSEDFSQETPHTTNLNRGIPLTSPSKQAVISIQKSFIDIKSMNKSSGATGTSSATTPTTHKEVVFNYQHLMSATRSHPHLLDFEKQLLSSPRDIVPLLSVAVAIFLTRQFPHDFSSLLPQSATAAEAGAHASLYSTAFSSPSLFPVRLADVAPSTPLNKISSSAQNTLVSITGHVLKVSTPRLLCTYASFVCQKCFDTSCHAQHANGTFKLPTSCEADGCRSRSFSLVVADELTRYVDHQRVTIQENQGDEAAGQVPRTIMVECTGSLINRCKAGDTALISGVVESMNSDHFANKGGKTSLKNSLFVLFLQANFIQTLGAVSYGNEGKNKSTQTQSTTLTMEQLSYVRRMSCADPGPPLPSLNRNAFPFDLLVNSLCPDIFGHEISKAGLLLTLFGGTPVATDESDPNATRSNIHIMIVGDPGMGKSMMLRRVSELAERSVYVGGNTSTTTGLTVSVVRDGSDTTLEAGALVLADHGLCCVDEFDKIQCDDAALLECMEQQSISVAKSGICTTLPARCSVVAAANPKSGRYNPNKSVAENLNMKTPLLSRFDMVFILQDRSDDSHDARLASHVMMHHKQEDEDSAVAMPPPPSRAPDFSQQTAKADGGYWGGGVTSKTPPAPPMRTGLDYSSRLVQRLKTVGAQQQPLPIDRVKDYIQYARQFCRPKLKREAAEVLRDYFMRTKYSLTEQGIPITTRQLEAMVRLAQARAKSCLRDWVTKEDAQDVTDLMSLSIIQTLTDAGGNLDASRKGVHGTSKMGKKRALVDALKRMMRDNHPNHFSEDEIMELKDSLELTVFSLRDALEEMREKGELFKKKDEYDEWYWMLAGGVSM